MLPYFSHERFLHFFLDRPKYVNGKDLAKSNTVYRFHCQRPYLLSIISKILTAEKSFYASSEREFVRASRVCLVNKFVTPFGRYVIFLYLYKIIRVDKSSKTKQETAIVYLYSCSCTYTFNLSKRSTIIVPLVGLYQ